MSIFEQVAGDMTSQPAQATDVDAMRQHVDRFNERVEAIRAEYNRQVKAEDDARTLRVHQAWEAMQAKINDAWGEYKTACHPPLEPLPQRTPAQHRASVTR